MSPEVLTVAMFVGLLIGLFMGHPLAFVLGGLAVIFGFLGPGPDVFGMIINRIFGAMDNYVLVAVPIFIFMARLLSDSGVADRMFEVMRQLLGPVRGGLTLAVIAVSVVLAATTGIIGASMTMMGLLALPSMLQHNYQKEMSCGAIAAGGSLGILIPPSIMLVIMGSFASISVGQLFAAALVPGLLLALMYGLYAGVLSYFKPEIGPPVSEEERSELNAGELFGLILKLVVPPMLLVLGVLGSIFAGIATATEAASIGAFIALLLVVVYGRFTWRGFFESVIESGKTTTMVLFVVVGATAFTGVFIAGGGIEVSSDFINGLGLGKWGTLVVMILMVFILGMFLDWLGIILICFPLFLPIVAEQGFDKLWFVVIVALVLQTSFLTPPFGYALFYLKGVAPEGVTTGHIYRGVVPFIMLILLGTLLCTIYPQIIMWLPRTMYG
ncbi:TRAP transporter large permease [Stutzerimonas stutzeri]|uniref:TRAP transporter large permease n=1 Tax=Stutzerimonas stutzeri TaxID=316 RepID=UPI00210B1F17|nr:TRAP transporter large permease subunit [Stutzerimonas stutzeri]MCQ4323027.1 TRAP transporter large permease subunit [Stutzerimonas stutzeri]